MPCGREIGRTIVVGYCSKWDGMAAYDPLKEEEGGGYRCLGCGFLYSYSDWIPKKKEDLMIRGYADVIQVPGSNSILAFKHHDMGFEVSNEYGKIVDLVLTSPSELRAIADWMEKRGLV